MKAHTLFEKSALFFAAMLLVLFSAGQSFPGVPQKISYQGYLVNELDEPLTGSYSVLFSIYDVQTGGTALWNETRTVSVESGVFNIKLGEVNTFPAGLFDDPRYIGIKVESDPEMTPRQEITSTAFSFRAENSELLNGMSSSEFALAGHEHDAEYINTGEADSVTSSMIIDSSIGISHIANGTVLDEILDDDGSGSGLDADRLDGLDSSSFFNLTENESVSGRPSFIGGKSGSTAPFNVDSTYLVKYLNADYLDGFHGASYVRNTQDYGRSGVSSNLYEGSSTLSSKYVNESGDSMSGELNITTNGKALDMTANPSPGIMIGLDLNASQTEANNARLYGFRANINNASPTNNTYGIYSDTEGDYATYGLYSNSSSTDHNAYGVFARGVSTNGASYGISSYASQDSSGNNNSPVYGINTNAYAYGTGSLWGARNYVYHYGTDGATYGARLYTYGSDDGSTYGVYASATNGLFNYGGYFSSAGSWSRGIYAQTSGTSGRAVVGHATNSSATANYGGHFEADGSYGVGIFAKSDNYYGIKAYGNDRGIYANASGTNGYGVYGMAGGTNGIGVSGFSSGSDGIGVRAYCYSGTGLYAFSSSGYAADINGKMRVNTTSVTHDPIELDPEEDSNGPSVKLRNSEGITTIELDAGYAGNDGRIITDELRIKGGSDLSEQFDIIDSELTVQPGMVVSINPDKPGKLRISSCAYDSRVAGIISGAGGIKPGMMMGQEGSAADGTNPVALTGRVYCRADTTAGAIKPGDLLTTSRIPGHAMKVTDHARANGAILGKAMTGLEDSRGLVLVLVSLQ